MSNSPLVTYTKLSPNHSGKRTKKIDRITPHCYVGQVTVERIGKGFANPDRKASCNYGIAKDGGIALIVEEKNRSWCTSSNANDQRAVTIECASDTTNPYAMTASVYKSLVNLCVDICKRNGKKKLLWLVTKEKSLNYTPKADEMVLTVHRWFAGKACPGDWLYSRMSSLAAEVTKKLGGSGSSSSGTSGESSSGSGVAVSYKVQVTASSLNIRKGPGTSYAVVGTITDKGTYTIIENSADGKWGKLKSGAGWISLNYTKKK